MATRSGLLSSVVMLSWLVQFAGSNSVQLQSHNINDILKNNELLFVNFYAEWCRFSQMLEPIFDTAAQAIKKEFPADGKVLFGKVDCDRETGIAHQYHVSKYPTLKMFRHGALVKKEYRGQRSVSAIGDFIRKQLTPAVETLDDLEKLDQLDNKQRHVIGYFDMETSPDYEIFLKVASMLRDSCKFHVAFGEVSESERTVGNKIVFQPGLDTKSKIGYGGLMNDYDGIQMWANDKCIPLVREITFENAEELTEEGLPFVILFHSPDDSDTPDKFRSLVRQELLAEKTSVNFLTADGHKFSHPLHHLGKTIHDLPVIAIDSFRHMYVWRESPRDSLERPEKMKAFIADLHSGKLHREFHNGPDPTTSPAPQLNEAPKKPADAADPNSVESADSTEDDDSVTHHVPNDPPAPHVNRDKPRGTEPPPSIFKKLAPSRTRYTLRDEL